MSVTYIYQINNNITITTTKMLNMVLLWLMIFFIMDNKNGQHTSIIVFLVWLLSSLVVYEALENAHNEVMLRMENIDNVEKIDVM